ncbi:MAG: M23 family metallopeptidase [Candidatus Nanopelagicales bacterium]
MTLCAALPVPAGRVASPYGWRWLNGRSDLHTGVDIGAPEGTPVYAMLPGRVIVAAPSGVVSGYGNVLVLQHGAAAFSLYAHLSRTAVNEGQSVNTGAQIGNVGRTAGTRAQPDKLFDVSGAHLHIEFLTAWPPAGKDENRLDPGPILAGLGVIVPAVGQPLRAVCPGSSSSEAQAPSSSPASLSTPRAAVVGGAGVLALLAIAYAYQQTKKRRSE